MKIKVEVPKGIRRSFIRVAKKVFPIENYGIFLGTINDEGIVKIKDIYYPPDVAEQSSENHVDRPERWFQAAQEYGEPDGLLVVGDIHSHCYKEKEADEACHAPSEQDWIGAEFVNKEFVHSYCVFAVCKIVERHKKLRASIKFWPVIRDVRTKITK